MSEQPTMTPAAADVAPSLPTDIAEPILAMCARLVAAFSLWQPSAIALPLNALPRTHAPLVTKAALMELPHIDLTWATQHDDIALHDFMVQWSKQPRGRPLNYDVSNVISFALGRGSPQVLEWWLDQPGLFVKWDWSDLELVEAFCEPVDLMWFEWWKARGYPFLELEDDEGASTFSRMAVHASRVGRVDIMDWLLENNAGAHWMAAAKGEDDNAIVLAARKGYVRVLEWWFLQAQAGVLASQIDWIQVFTAALYKGQTCVLEWCKNQPAAMEAWQQESSWIDVFAAAFASSHVAVLEWCKSQPSVMQAWRQCLEKSAHTADRSKISSMCSNVVGKGGLDWSHAFDLLPFAEGNVNVSRAACEKGELDLVKELRSRGCLLGSRKQLIQAALESGKLELLEWIQANIDPSIPDSNQLSSRIDPFYTACRDLGNVDILDWLIANAYKFPPPGERRARIFSSASCNGRLEALEWLFRNSFAKNMSMEDWSSSVQSASCAGHIDVLDWLAEWIPRATSGTTVEPLGQIPSAMMLREAFSHGRVDVIEWWMHKSGWLKDVYDLSHGQPYLQACNELGGPTQLAALNTWFHAGQPMDFAKCIHVASVSGRIDVLDWLLHSVKAPEEHFVKAWTSDEFPDEITAENMYAYSWFDTDHHGRSLMWWSANAPHICTILPVNRGPYENPIHAHMFKYRLNNSSFRLQEPFDAIESFSGHVPLLEYRKQHCHVQELESEEADRCLEEACEDGYCHVLAWWKASGLKMSCPDNVANGHTRISKRVKHWWAKSGLVDEQQLGKMKTE